MSQTLLTQGIESATITFTNAGAGSTESLIQNRDARVLSLDVASGTSTVQVEVDYGTDTDIDYFVLGTFTTSGSVAVKLYEWNGSSYVLNTTDSSVTGDGSNYFLSLSSTTATKYRIDIERASARTVTASFLFMGEVYTMPKSYYYNNARETFVRGEVGADSDGYPHAHAIGSTKKHRWDVEYGFTKANIIAVEAQLLHAGFNQKPFIWRDDNVSTGAYLLVKMRNESIRADQPGADFYRARLQLEEL